MKEIRLLELVVAGALLGLACASARHATPVSSTSADCGPGLTDEQVVASAKRALRLMWGREPALDRYDVSVQAQGCNYVFIAGQLGLEAREDILIIVDRSGRVKTIPVCCDLGDCPEFCKQ